MTLGKAAAGRERCVAGRNVEHRLGHVSWREATRGALAVEGDRNVTERFDRWLRLDRIVGTDLPMVPPRSA